MQRPPIVYLTHRINSAEIQRLHPWRTSQGIPAQTSTETHCMHTAGWIFLQTLALSAAEQDGQIAGVKCVTEI